MPRSRTASRRSRLAAALERALASLAAGAAWLVLPLALLLFLQWPLRELVQAYSREANDLGQWLFALYVAVAIARAGRRRAHLATDVVAHRYPASVRNVLVRTAAAVALVPWTVFVLVTGSGMAWRSLVGLEAFPETFNPGYFMIKAAAWLLALLLLGHAVLDLLRPERQETA